MTQITDTSWLMIVARAAPLTPMPKPNMKIGSRMMFETAPIATESIPVRAKPCAVMK